MLAAGARLHVIELDRDLADRLDELAMTEPGLTVHRGDALEFDFAALAGEIGPLRVVGNLPYNISTPLLFHLLDSVECIAGMLFMLQAEVVDRLAAGPGEDSYGRLSVMVQWRCAVDRLFRVPPGAFRPPPKVTSAVVRLTPRAQPLADPGDPRVFAELVRRAFGQRRKTLRNALRGYAAPDRIAAAGIDPGARAETLAVAAFAALSRVLSAGVAAANLPQREA